jgi:adenosine deaminase CECR1
MANALSDEAAWKEAEGIPAFDDSFIQKYLEGRDALVEQEKKQRSGLFLDRLRFREPTAI